MTEMIRQLALQALEDDEALPVLGDAVLEAGWFDRRVMQTMMPAAKRRPKGMYRSKYALEKEKWKEGFPLFFQAYASKPTRPWARAILAVFLFGRWRVHGWPLTKRMPRFYGGSTIWF